MNFKSRTFYEAIERPKKAEMEIMYDATYRTGRVTLQHINARPVSPENDFSRQSYDAGGRNSIRTSSSARSSMIQGHNEYVYIPIEFILTHF